MKDTYHIKFVNLKHRTDRLSHMNSELSRVGIPAERFEAIDWKSREWGSDYQTMFIRTPGACGCHESQVSIIKEAKLLEKSAIVFEDDLIFCSDFHERMKIIEAFTSENDWDVVWLGGTFHVPAFWHRVGSSGMPPDCSAQLGKDCETTSNPRIMRTYGAFSTFAYIVNHKSIDKILALFDRHIHTSIGIDWLFIKLQPQLKTFAFVPGCVKQMDNMSDIGTGMTMFSGFSKLNGTLENSAYWFQDKMENFDPTKFNWG